jgi:hypothetical protein
MKGCRVGNKRWHGGCGVIAGCPYHRFHMGGVNAFGLPMMVFDRVVMGLL